jgi:hypothetical protein
MAAQASLMRRWEEYRPSKTVLLWSCAACAVATIVVGFGWGGWVTGGTNAQMVAQASSDARVGLTASLCVERFAKGPDQTAQLAALKSTDTWKQDKFIEDGGWVTVPGTAIPVAGAGELCAKQIIEAAPPAKAASTAG